MGSLTPAAYLEQLLALMPRGRAWPRYVGSVLRSLLGAEAAELAAVDRAATVLLDEVRPNTTFDLLPDWEHTAGLPDECSSLASTVAERRAAVVGKLVAQPDLNPESFKRIGRSFGVEITVREHDKAAADAIAGLDTSGGRWRFVWWIEIPTTSDFRYFDTLSDVNTPLLEVERNPELECRLRKARPAHTHLVLGYVDPARA